MSEPDRSTIASEVALLKERLGRLGLWQTMHAMERPLTIVGFELAGEDPERIAKYVDRKEAGR